MTEIKEVEDKYILQNLVRTAYSIQHTTSRFGAFCAGFWIASNLLLTYEKGSGEEISLGEVLSGLDDKKISPHYALTLYEKYKEWEKLEGRQEKDRDKDFRDFIDTLKKILKGGKNGKRNKKSPEGMGTSKE